MPPASAGASAAELRRTLLDLLEPLVADAGYDLEDVSVSRAGRRSIVRVVLDRDGGIDLDAVSEASRLVSGALDDSLDGELTGTTLARTLAGSYTLEVTSPGVDRPLTEARHWRRNTGRLVTTEIAGKAVTARVLDAGDTGVTLDVAGTRRDVAWADLGHGRVQVEFNRKSEEG